MLFGRAVVSTLAVVSGGLGFLTGIRLQSPNLRSLRLCHRRRRAVRRRLRRHRLHADAPRAQEKCALETRIEELSDRNWELREAEERARSLLKRKAT